MYASLSAAADLVLVGWCACCDPTFHRSTLFNAQYGTVVGHRAAFVVEWPSEVAHDNHQVTVGCIGWFYQLELGKQTRRFIHQVAVAVACFQIEVTGLARRAFVARGKARAAGREDFVLNPRQI